MDDEDIIQQMFYYIEIKDWKSLETAIKNDNCPSTNYNLKNRHKKIIMEYLIENNQVSILELLFTKQHIYIDLIGASGKTILYEIIKNNQIQILKIILHYNDKLIGKNILNVADVDGNIPVFYAIQFNNPECLQLILKSYFNIYSKNKSGNNVLHYLIETMDNVEILKILHSININIGNSRGETPLHLAIKHKRYESIYYLLNHKKVNLNAVELEYELSILHYCCILYDKRIFSYFKKIMAKINVNVQDRFGKTAYFYFIDNVAKTHEMDNFNEIILKNFDYNLFDINGDIPCHFALKLYKKLEIFDSLIANLIAKSNLNIQNIIGESCLHLIVKLDIWKKYENILTTKKLDIFIKSKNAEPPINFIKKANLNEFIKMVAKSYMYQLNKKGTQWSHYWDKKCANLSKMKLNENDKLFLKENGISLQENNKNICLSIFENAIIREHSSYPISSIEDNVKITIEEYPKISEISYFGSTIEILCGLIHLMTKHDNINACINITDIVKCKKGTKNCEATGFFATWKNNVLTNFILPTKSHRFFVIPIEIEVILNNSSFYHLNYVLFDLEKEEAERFEPHGSYSPFGFDYNAELLDKILEKEIGKNYKYFKPSTYLPKIGFQTREINEEGLLPLTDPDGFCSLWCLWWCDMRSTYKNINRVKLVKLLFKEIISSGISLKNMIRNYSYFVTSIRDVILNNAKTNMVKWKNNDMEMDEIHNLNVILKEEIESLNGCVIK